MSGNEDVRIQRERIISCCAVFEAAFQEWGVCFDRSASWTGSVYYEVSSTGGDRIFILRVSDHSPGPDSRYDYACDVHKSPFDALRFIQKKHGFRMPWVLSAWLGSTEWAAERDRIGAEKNALRAALRTAGLLD